MCRVYRAGHIEKSQTQLRNQSVRGSIQEHAEGDSQMKLPNWLTDSIARRFALTEVLTVTFTLGLVLLSNGLSDRLGHEPLARTGLLDEVTDMVEMVETAPANLRQSLAAAVGSPGKRVVWFAETSATASFLDRIPESEQTASQVVSAKTHHRALVVPDSVVTLSPLGPQLGRNGSFPYVLAVRLFDHSWVVFATPNRSWGIPRVARWSIWLVFLTVSILLFTLLATRQFARPIEALAAAVREFGVNPAAPAIAEAGPRELRQVIITFNQMQAQIRKFVSHRTAMLAAISHDLRTPLTRMRLRGELIEDPVQQERLFRDVDEMQTMIDGALAFFRDDAILEPSTNFDIANVLLSIANDYADQRIDVRYTGPAPVAYRGRPFALERALTNLVDNAIKYATPPRIELERSATGLVVWIRDDGPGIPEEFLGDVLLPYYRLEKSRNRTTGGVGLGLTVAQSIIHSHGGDILLRNAAAGGLEVRVSLPLVSVGT